MRVGDVVKIMEGPFAGLDGRLKEFGPRVLIVLDVYGREIDVEMDREWVSEVVPETLTVSAG